MMCDAKKMMLMVAAAGLISGVGQTAQANLVITEVQSNSSHPGGPGNGDWFELTNAGGVAIDLENYYWDDDGPTGNDGALFPAISINAGESIVIVNEGFDDDEAIDELPIWLSSWGGGFIVISKDDFGGPDDFSGLSSGGDQIEIWDADPNAGPANLVASAFFGPAPGDGATFEWDLNGNSLGNSVAGENGAFVAVNDGSGGTGLDVGSPGSAVPEPSSLALLALGGLAIARRRRS